MLSPARVAESSKQTPAGGGALLPHRSPQEKADFWDLLTGIQGIGFADPFPTTWVIAGDIDKGRPCALLLRHLGLEASQVLAMGTGERLAPPPAAGIGVAMANATERGEGRGGLRHHQ